MLRTLCPSALALLIVLAPSTWASDIEPNLQAEMNRRSANEMIPVIAMMADRVDLADLDARLDKMNATRRARHEIVVRTLQDKANTTQPALLDELGRLANAGHVEDFRPLWITNGVLLKIDREGILTLAQNEAIEELYFGGYVLELIEPVDKPVPAPKGKFGSPSPQAPTIEPGLLDIKADFLWNLGFTGSTRLVSNIDTGVLGTHSALQRWRGNDAGVTPAEAWFDPVTNTTFPFDFSGHGSHTMGTICGSDASNITGVAYEAKYIAAGVIDRVSIPQTIADAILAFQWTADPDGNPATIDDVPDCSSNSWGISPIYHGVPHCDSTFWEVINGCESAGVAVIFAAGNEGSGSITLRTPADRITTVVDSLAIGSLQPGSTVISSFSSRGPSGCDSTTIKPEVCAQGENVRSAWNNGSFVTISGTSMACPHAAGSVTLLREVNPNLSSRRVKEILIETADDLGASGEDNTYGHGRINLQSAYNKIISELPTVSVAMVTSQYIAQQGSTHNYFITLINHSGVKQFADVKIEVRNAADALLLTLYNIPNIGIGANFNNDVNPFHLTTAVAASVPPALLNVPLKGVTKLFVPGTSTLISEAEFTFKVQ